MPDAYDQVRYPSSPHDQTHPAYVSALAMLVGVELPPVERWRVLEIGCGNGSNIIPLAADYPTGEFFGIDRAKEPLAAGRELAADLELSNFILETADLLDWQPPGTFDYIIAHGVYSWVPPEVRNRILRICAEHLKPSGIAYISYNALPGCYFRRFAWDLLRFHTRRETDPARKIEKAREFAQTMASMPGDEPLQPGIRNEFETILKRDPAALYHDDLSERNDPFYLLDFAAEARRHGLQYLWDADPRRDDLQDQPPFADDWLEARQYMDFVRGKRFRETLLCRTGVQVRRDLSLERFGRLYGASRLNATEVMEDGAQVFVFPNSTTRLTTNHPLAKSILFRLSEIWPRFIQLSELGYEGYAADSVTEMLMRLVGSKAIEVRIHPPRIAESIVACPVASALVRAQIARGYTTVTNQRHQDVELENELSRKFISLLDGSRDRPALIRDLVGFGADPVTTPQTLESGLLEMHRLCLFTG